MEQYISKSALVAEIERKQKEEVSYNEDGSFASLGDQIHYSNLESFKHLINTLEVKEVDLVMHTIIAECCDWLAMNTNLSQDKIECCRNLMLTVKEEQCNAQKGEEV